MAGCSFWLCWKRLFATTVDIKYERGSVMTNGSTAVAEPKKTVFGKRPATCIPGEFKIAGKSVTLETIAVSDLGLGLGEKDIQKVLDAGFVNSDPVPRPNEVASKLASSEEIHSFLVRPGDELIVVGKESRYLMVYNYDHTISWRLTKKQRLEGHQKLVFCHRQ